MVSIIIPTYNEAGNIRKLVPEIFKHNVNSEIIIVDDNSPDGTARVAEDLGKWFTVRVVKRPRKMGLGSAVIEGFRHAKSDIIGVMDADFSHPPEKIPELVKALRDCDIAIGSRNVKGGGIENWPLKRRLMSKGATWIARILTSVKDPMSGFFFMKKPVINGVKLETKGYKILMEILVKGRYKRVREIPYIFRDRQDGESKLDRGEMGDYFKTVSKLWWKKVRG